MPGNKRLVRPLLRMIAEWAEDESEGRHGLARSTLAIKFESEGSSE